MKPITLSPRERQKMVGKLAYFIIRKEGGIEKGIITKILHSNSENRLKFRIEIKPWHTYVCGPKTDLFFNYWEAYAYWRKQQSQCP